MTSLGRGRVEIGCAEWLLDEATTYANEREAFDERIGQYQAISHKIARGQANALAADAVGLKCAWLLDQGEPAIAESSILKWFASNAFWETADDVVQIHGANGLAEENPFMDRLHRVRIQRVVEGTDEIQLDTIAKQYGVET
ncbi:acyl-CoA dehydrogenase family protein [Natrinema amylolyticum]|uniref:acyl-CoA dehydrogenase family protein n=1 Tax=Natrinema amylolyticum TaxID=2878679 RepID=UPI001CF9801F|nr:acyl-CoA dehydrogenase family protein [Natrinema amylolyticum]